MVGMKRLGVCSLAALGLLVVTAGSRAEAATMKIALLSQWSVNQHRSDWNGTPIPAFRSALESGVVDGPVFSWQRGTIQRSSLVGKPIRVLSGSESTSFGGHGEFELTGIRGPSGSSAWIEVDIVPRTAQPDDVMVLQIGGDSNVLRQLLESMFIVSGEGALSQLRLARRSLIPGDGVPVVLLPPDRSILPRGTRFRGTDDVQFLVLRSPVEVVPYGGVTPNDRADLAFSQGGEWREGDRVFVRMPLSALRGIAPSIVLGWRDRVLRPDPDPPEPLRR
jgi:hypothetical protein